MRIRNGSPISVHGGIAATLAVLAALVAGCDDDHGTPAASTATATAIAAATATSTAAPSSTSIPEPTPTATRNVGETPCPDYVPTGCTEVAPGDVLPAEIKSCYVIKQAGSQPYVFDKINITNGGALYFVEAPGQTIDLRVNSLLVEYGGVLQAGSPACPFGFGGGRLEIGLYGDDPSMQGSIDPAPPGIQCMTAPGDSSSGCFPKGRDPDTGQFYCTVTDSDDPCSSTEPPAEDAANFLLEPYHNLNFDPTPWGYKVLGVSYGGTLRLFGWKGAKATPDGAHCDVPSAEESTLNAAEMQDWANLSYSSWARLDGSQDMSDGTTVLTLDRDVPSWQENDDIVVGTTDWYPSHSEQRTVKKVAHVTTPAGLRTQLTVDQLTYPHVAAMFDADALAKNNGAEYTGPVSRTAADLRASVGLLTRSIAIHSLGAEATDAFPDVASCLYQPGPPQLCSIPGSPFCTCGASGATDPSCYFGGQLIFRQGFKEVQLQGVEFKQLGQGGRMGHYPVHFHLDKSTAYTQGKAYVKDSAVWDSMTRFVTVHGTHDVAVMRNVGYLSVGHGYYIEDGSEIDNLLCYNLGVEARASLEEYFVAQADPKNWPCPLCGDGAVSSTPPPTARFVPPILDGVSPTTSFPDGNMMSPIDPNGPSLRNGSDSLMPVMFWMMNAHNEFVGNDAVGVHGFGSCYWLLGSGVSGPSVSDVKFAGLANYNLAGNYQAPLLRFRGNSCTTATYGLPASAEVSPSELCDAFNTGFTPITSPYVYNSDGSLKPVNELIGKFARPAVVGNFQPIEPNTAGVNGVLFSNCAPQAESGQENTNLEPNTKSCSITLIDRFTTSFNWAEVNYGSIWLRPWFYLLLNPAVTDQLFGGVTFVTAGSWLQVPPAYFSLAKNGLFAGSTQHGGSKYAQRSGPIFSVTADDDLSAYAPCNHGGFTTCNLDSEGVGYWTGGLQPKRLINIYDGPHYADDNLFLNVGAWQCDPQPCLGKSAGECVTDLPCGIYSSTTQPAANAPGQGIDPHKMIVLDAAIGWKQPNGFFYPPAFTYRDATFFKKLPTGLPDPDPSNPLDQCFSFSAADGFTAPSFLPGDCRHNAVDRTRDYLSGSMKVLNGGPTEYPAQLNQQPNTPIDFSTILIDLNASLTGASGTISGVDAPVPTTSVSRNPFFDAPAQSDECLAFGVQTTPYEAVTTNVAQLKASPASGDTYIEPWTFQSPPPPVIEGTSPVIAIYRQWATAADTPNCEQVCDSTNPTQYGCSRGTFMVGPNVGQATYLTLAQPPGLSGQGGSLYYIDTSTLAKQPLSCIQAKTLAMLAPPFTAGGSYLVYDLFARNDSVISYQLNVGGDDVNDLSAINGRFVRVTPHLTSTDNSNGLSSLRSLVVDACDPTVPGGWCASMPMPTVEKGILTVTLDQRPIAADFEASKRGQCTADGTCKADYNLCMPRDLCYFDGTQCQPCLNEPSKCIRQDDFMSVDLDSMNHPDATGKMPLDVVCQDWATYTSGTTSATLGELSLVDCPAGGCLGFAFTLAPSFDGNETYAQKGAPLVQCFNQSSWMDDALVERGASMGVELPDPLCGPPRQQMPTDYCTGP